ncbi:MAG: DNA alkylation repair protein [Nanoarchaeota archaeon]|jgi:3-methyladenine DNA glycosylase AlkD|nr:DNA alkylation repair protein [Nanoarchaeota archaeon]|tara:strand:+ start:16409 stop:17098 length:690 start_codon:yes stop_codon:yes gene_type:complete
MLSQLQAELKSLENPEKAKIYQRFFKTGKGEYGEGDIFLGLTVPQQRQIAKKYPKLSLEKIQELLKSKIHEERVVALMILKHKYQKDSNKKEIIDFYLKNTENINNWDLVDGSAPYILGNYLLDKDRQPLYDLAISENLWGKRISIISTFEFIKNDQFEDTIKISEILLKDTHDLIHKAVGWMLRELGKKDQSLLEEFLNKHTKNMPRTMLRYAIEKFEETKRQYYLKK